MPDVFVDRKGLIILQVRTGWGRGTSRSRIGIWLRMIVGPDNLDACPAHSCIRFGNKSGDTVKSGILRSLSSISSVAFGVVI